MKRIQRSESGQYPPNHIFFWATGTGKTFPLICSQIRESWDVKSGERGG